MSKNMSSNTFLCLGTYKSNILLQIHDQNQSVSLHVKLEVHVAIKYNRWLHFTFHINLQFILALSLRSMFAIIMQSPINYLYNIDSINIASHINVSFIYEYKIFTTEHISYYIILLGNIENQPPFTYISQTATVSVKKRITTP